MPSPLQESDQVFKLFLAGAVVSNQKGKEVMEGRGKFEHVAFVENAIQHGETESWLTGSFLPGEFIQV